MTLQEVVEKLQTKPSYLGNGAGSLSRQFKCSRDTIKEAKRIVRDERILDDTPDGMKLKSMWGKDGSMQKSYTALDTTKDDLTDFKNVLLSELSDISKPKRFKQAKGNYLLELALPDYHFGKIDGLSIDEQAEKFVAAGLNLFDKAYDDGVSRVLLPIGNDFFNSESTQTTTKGTPQQNNSTFYEMFTKGWTSIVTLVDEISKNTPVDIIVIPGNHDTVATIMLGEVLKGYYSKNKMVTVDSDDEFTKYYAFGNNLFMLNHGDKIKPQNLALMLAVEQPHLFANCDYKYIRLGHFHKQMHDELMGIEVTFLPSIGGSDAWHRASGYLSKPKATATLFHSDYGKSSVYNIYLEHIKL